MAHVYTALYSLNFNESYLTVAEWREARLLAARPDDDLVDFAAGAAANPSLPAATGPATVVPPTGGGSALPAEDVRETAQRRVDAAWADARAELAYRAFEPYETSRLATLLEQAASAMRTDRNRRTVQPLARRRPLVPPPPRAQPSDGTLRQLGRGGRPRGQRDAADVAGAESAMQRLAAAPALDAPLPTAPTKRRRLTQAASQASQVATQDL
jgi:hypothetical protein